MDISVFKLHGSQSGPSFSKHLKSVTMVTCLSPKFIHQNKLLQILCNCLTLCFSQREPI